MGGLLRDVNGDIGILAGRSVVHVNHPGRHVQILPDGGMKKGGALHLVEVQVRLLEPCSVELLLDQEVMDAVLEFLLGDLHFMEGEVWNPLRVHAGGDNGQRSFSIPFDHGPFLQRRVRNRTNR